MTATARAVVVLAATVAHGGAAGADDGAPVGPPKLALEREPPPRHLRMRARTAQTQPVAAVKKTPMPRAPAQRATDLAPIAGIDGVRDVKQPVSFSLSVGYQIDGSTPTGRASLDAGAPRRGIDYETLRSYGFAEGFLSTRGVGFESLSSYFSLRFQAARELVVDRDDLPMELEGRKVTMPSPIATWFDRSGAELRTGWGELRDFLPRRWGLQRLRVRIGDQYIYAPWIVHMFGTNIAYEGKTVTLSLFSGLRRSDYTRVQENNQPFTSGGTFRFDLRGLVAKVPIAVDGEWLGISESTATGQPASTSSHLQVDWRPDKDIVFLANQRWLDGNVANQRLEIRTRFGQVTNVVFELARRLESDWRWDPTLVRRENRLGDPLEAKRYLDLGPPRPQMLFSLRGGTLIKENIDLFARVAASSDQSDNETPPQSYTASYLELAGAVELRLRRTIALGGSILTRTSERITPASIVDVRNSIEPLPESSAIGEDRFVEGGGTARMTLGARRFSALLELYYRRTRFQRVYEDPLLPVAYFDGRGGGRFTIDAWVGKRIRLFASYDVSTALQNAPEITGYKSLRLTLTGVY